MQDPIDFYRQRIAGALNAGQNSGAALGAIASGVEGFMQGQDLKRQRDRQALLFQQQQEDRQRKIASEQRAADEARLKAHDEEVGRLAMGGFGEAAVGLYNQDSELRKKLRGTSGPQIMGRVTREQQVADPMSAALLGSPLAVMGMGISPEGMSQAQGAAQTVEQRNYNDPQTLRALIAATGTKPIEASAGTSLMTYGGQVLGTAPNKPGSDKPVGGQGTGYYTFNQQTGKYDQVIGAAPSFSSAAGGQATHNNRTGEVKVTGFMPQITPAEQGRLDIARSKQKLDEQTAGVKTRVDADKLKMAHRKLNLQIVQREAGYDDFTGKPKPIDRRVLDALNEESDALVDSAFEMNQVATDRANANAGALGGNPPGSPTPQPAAPQATAKTETWLTNLFGKERAAVAELYPEQYQAMVTYFTDKAQGKRRPPPFGASEAKRMREAARKSRGSADAAKILQGARSGQTVVIEGLEE